MQAGVLLHVAELLEAPVAVGALVGLLSGVDADVLHQLVVGGERLETLLALVRLHLAAVHLTRVQLHRRLVHEDLQQGAGRRSVSRSATGRGTEVSVRPPANA